MNKPKLKKIEWSEYTPGRLTGMVGDMLCGSIVNQGDHLTVKAFFDNDNEIQIASNWMKIEQQSYIRARIDDAKKYVEQAIQKELEIRYERLLKIMA